MRSPHFPFTREPFPRDIQASEAFVSEGHREVQARLRNVVETGGSLAVVTGHVGAGKSVAVRAIIHAMDASRYRFIYMASSAMAPIDFYKGILYQVNVQPRRGFSENKRLVSQTMLDLSQKGIKPVVVVDEAQELTVPMLGEFRFALNYQADSYSPLAVILLGQPPLLETLRLQILECIRQRISVHYQLPPLCAEEVSAYILHHLRIAGLDRQVFTEEAVSTVCQFSKGIPRRINNICRYALVAATNADRAAVEAEDVRQALEEALGNIV